MTSYGIPSRFQKFTPLHQNLGESQYSQNTHLQNQSLIYVILSKENPGIMTTTFMPTSRKLVPIKANFLVWKLDLLVINSPFEIQNHSH